MDQDKQTKVLIVGTYSGLNKGDRLMQQVTIKALKDLGLEPVLASPFPKIDTDIYPEVTVIKCGRRNLPLSLVKCLILLFTPKPLRNSIAKFDRELNEFKKSSYVIDTSGDMLTEDYGVHVAISHLIPLIFCVLLEKRFLILAQSIGPFNKIGFLWDKVLNKATTITTRDSISYNYLKARGLTNIAQVADLGFLLPAKQCSLNCIDRLKKSSKDNIIGICPSALFFEKFSSSTSETNIQLFCSMLDRVAERNSISYLILPHVMTPNAKMDDQVFSVKLSKILKSNSEIVNSNLEPASMKYIIASLDGVISFRMHGAIAAVDSFVPTIAISYSHKTVGLFEKLGLEQWVVENDKNMLSNLYLLIEKLLKEKASLKEHLEFVVPQIRKEAARNFYYIKGMTS